MKYYIIIKKISVLQEHNGPDDLWDFLQINDDWTFSYDDAVAVLEKFYSPKTQHKILVEETDKNPPPGGRYYVALVDQISRRVWLHIYVGDPIIQSWAGTYEQAKELAKAIRNKEFYNSLVHDIKFLREVT